MFEWGGRWGSAIAVSSLLLGVSTAGIATTQAEEAVLVPGATVFKPINPLYPYLARNFYPVIGEHFHVDDDPRVVDYSQNALASDRAIRDGVTQVNAAVANTDGDVVVIGESMGSMVAARVAAELDATPGAPENVRFVLIAPPEVGIAEYFKEGTYIPLLNYRVSRLPQSSYPTTIVIGEYDGWADPPDRPWNLLAMTNAVFGMAFVHGAPIAAANPADVPPENITEDGNVTTYLVPTEDLPLTQPLRAVGVPDRVADKADQVLRPVIDAGYVRHDKPGDTRPYLHDGEIRRAKPSARDVSEPRPQRLAAPLERRQDRSQPRQERRIEGLKRVVAGLKHKNAERQERQARLAKRLGLD